MQVIVDAILRPSRCTNGSTAPASRSRRPPRGSVFAMRQPFEFAGDPADLIDPPT